MADVATANVVVLELGLLSHLNPLSLVEDGEHLAPVREHQADHPLEIVEHPDQSAFGIGGAESCLGSTGSSGQVQPPLCSS